MLMSGQESLTSFYVTLVVTLLRLGWSGGSSARVNPDLEGPLSPTVVRAQAKLL